MLRILIFTGFIFKASASYINGYGNTTGVYGGDARYSCAVADPKGVLQVTWQRLFQDESIENLATYSKRFGQQVNEPYRGKVVFGETSLHSTSITLRNVTWEDESCYICSFNVYPDGSKRKQICLTVQGISGMHTSVHVPGSDYKAEEAEEVVFSCSATGRPAPTIQWRFPPSAALSHTAEPARVTNGDNTFTTSSNITLRVPPGWSGHADCLLNGGQVGERRERITLSLGGDHGDEEEEEEEGRHLSSSGVALIISTLFFAAVVVAAVVLKRRKLRTVRRNENETSADKATIRIRI